MKFARTLLFLLVVGVAVSACSTEEVLFTDAPAASEAAEAVETSE